MPRNQYNKFLAGNKVFLKKILNIYKSIFPVKTNSITFELTQKCNLNCGHCYNVWKSGKNYPAGELNFTRTKELIAKIISETGCRSIVFTGGEPLLRPDIFELISYVRSFNIDLILITNGTLLTEQFIKKTIELKKVLFELPLLSDDRNVHNEMTGCSSFDRVIEAIGNIRNYGGTAVTVFVATSKNINRLKETLELNAALGIRAVMFNRINPGGRAIEQYAKLIPDKTRLEEAFSIIEETATKYGIQVNSSIPIQPCIIDMKKYKSIGDGFCSAGTSNAYFTIDPLGNLRICNHTSKILGNCFESTFQELVSGIEKNDLVCAIPKYCVNCKDAKSCRGGCPAAADECFGSAYEPDPFLKEHIEKARR